MKKSFVFQTIKETKEEIEKSFVEVYNIFKQESLKEGDINVLPSLKIARIEKYEEKNKQAIEKLKATGSGEMKEREFSLYLGHLEDILKSCISKLKTIEL